MKARALFASIAAATGVIAAASPSLAQEPSQVVLIAPAPQKGAPWVTLPPPVKSLFSFETWAGFTYRRLYDIPIYGADFGVMAGVLRGDNAYYGGMAALVGRTQNGLLTYTIKPQFQWEHRFDRVRLGLSVGVPFVAIQRVTSDGTMFDAGFGGSASISVDVLRAHRNALFVGAKMTAEVLFADEAPLIWGPTVLVGWRYR